MKTRQMTTAQVKGKLVARKPVEKIPLHVRRETIVFQRAHRVFGEVTSIIEGPATRTCLKDHIEALLTEAGSAFCDYLYAKANGKHHEAVRRWEEVQGLVEYELPMCLLRPVKGLKQRRSREKAAKAVVRIIAAEMPGYIRRAETPYATLRSGAIDKGVRAGKRHRPTKPVKRPDKASFRDFPLWIESVITTTFEVEEIHGGQRQI